MGTRLIAVGVDAEKYAVEMNVPVIRGLKGVFLTNTDDKKIKRNYAPIDAKPLTASAGEPVIYPNRMTCRGMVDAGGAGYVDTGVKETALQTFIVIFKPKTDAWPAGWAGVGSIPLDSNLRAMPLSTHLGSVPAFGAAMYVSGTKFMSVFAGVTAADGVTSTSATRSIAADFSVWNAFSGRVTATGLMVKNHTSGASATGNYTEGNVRRVPDRTFRIGSSYSSSYGGISDIAAIQIHDVVLTDAEVDTATKWLVDYVARKGIIVGQP
jgi:hypothetical protein